jgi:DAK2 domain fusion protein YloV
MNPSTDDILEFLEIIIAEGDAVLQKTPDMLPVLKQAGVVDSGGAGLMQVLKGVYAYLNGDEIDLSFGEGKEMEKPAKVYTYKLSFVLVPEKTTSKERVNDFESYLKTAGDEITFKNHSEFVEISILTDVPGEIITKSCALGTAHEIAFSNAIDEKNGFKRPEAKAESATPAKEIGFVSVSAGDGMNQIFTDMGVDVNITGGQTMNPSTDDILSAIEKVNAKTVFVLPNNKNIILAANQAVALSEDKRVVVIPTTTVPQGITALINYLPDKSVEENKAIMEEEIKNVQTGSITYAVRDTEIDDKVIKSGDYMGIGDKGIISVGPDKDEVFMSMLKEMVSEETSLITIYFGSDVTEGEANEFAERIGAEFSNVEIDVENGGQPVYYYVVSVE